jgi:hypothetical protein
MPQPWIPQKDGGRGPIDIGDDDEPAPAEPEPAEPAPAEPEPTPSPRPVDEQPVEEEPEPEAPVSEEPATPAAPAEDPVEPESSPAEPPTPPAPTPVSGTSTLWNPQFVGPLPAAEWNALAALHGPVPAVEIVAPPTQASTPTPNHTWLSDLRWTSAKSGWGPVERDRANGQRDQMDGSPITIDGTIYRKGLGVAKNSQVVYQLDGKYQKFFSVVGLDDTASADASVTFQVWADGKKLFDSGRVTHDTRPRKVSLNVLGVQRLRLVTTDQSGRGQEDHADWAAARLVRAVSTSAATSSEPESSS